MNFFVKEPFFYFFCCFNFFNIHYYIYYLNIWLYTLYYFKEDTFKKLQKNFQVKISNSLFFITVFVTDI